MSLNGDKSEREKCQNVHLFEESDEDEDELMNEELPLLANDLIDEGSCGCER